MMKNFSIKQKITFLTLSGLILLATALALLSVNKSKEALLKAQLDKLNTVKSAKTQEVNNYFNYLKGLLVSLAGHEGTKEAFSAFEEGFYTLQNELRLDINTIKSELESDFTINYLDSINYNIPNSSQRRDIKSYLPKDPNALVAQYVFITDNNAKLGEKNNLIYNEKYNSSYMQAHQKYHKTFDNFLNAYELYDIFMVDLKGNLIYTDFKEKDYATNLINGVYGNSGIARVYKKALNINEGELAFEDFAPYEPSYNSAASFIATPIFVNNVKKGVLIFQMPVDRINAIIQFEGKFQEAGLGKSGEAYLVGQDFKMRSNSRFQKEIKNKTVQALGSTIGVWEIKTKSSEAAINGINDSGEWIITDYRGIEVLSVYQTINLFDQAKWALIAEIDQDEALQASFDLRNTILIISIVLLTIIALIVIYFVNKMIVTPIKQFQTALLGFFKYLNRESSDVSLIINDNNDEIGLMAIVVNENIQRTKKSLDEDRQVINDTISVLNEFEQGDLCQRVKTSCSNPALQELTGLLNQMGSNMESNIENVLNILEEYSTYNYLNRVETNNIKEHLLKLANGVNLLGDSITEMLIDNKQNGLMLDKSSNILLKNVDLLNNNSNQAAAALEETAAALEEVTANVSSTTSNVVQMANLANEVTKAVTTGEGLANETTVAMDEINKEVNAINDAITVIDQIAFQTNILSLNAAVEAATAGEAGKGFAVVAAEVRNLASRSAEAANEIKALVENATNKADTGKKIADNMIDGYKGLNASINKTIELIKDIETASKEQQSGIIQINDAINSLDKQTQENATVASETYTVAIETDSIAKSVVASADQKEFKGKNDLRVTTNSKYEIDKQKTFESKPAISTEHLESSNSKDKWTSF